MRHSLFLLAPFAAVLLAGCANKETVVVLPAADGHIGGVVVQSGGKTVVLDRAYEAAHPGDGQAAGGNPAGAPILAALPVGVGEDGLATDLLEGDVLRRMVRRRGDRQRRGDAFRRRPCPPFR